MNLNEQFQAAVEQVNNLPGDAAAKHMTELYGLYKQATEGDVNMPHDEVDADAADQANGPAGLSQAQWDSWNHYKGLPEDEAKQQYVNKVSEINGAAAGQPAQAVPTDAQTGAPTQGAAANGLHGDITAGAPYGGEDQLKDRQ